MTVPFVSCLCPTFNRAPDYLHLVEEAVESFLRQDYPADRRELIILNDTPEQFLIPPCGTFDGENCRLGKDNIRIYNRQERITSLGEKRNALVELAIGDLLLPWDDDDISLPHRISQAVARVGPAHYWNPQRSWFLDARGLHHNHRHGYCHNASVFTGQAWKQVGGYPAVSGSEDADLDRLLKALGALPPRLSDDSSEWSYIYRWGVSSRHLSGQAGGPIGDPHAPHYRQIGQEAIIPGRFALRPHWREDYVARTRASLEQSSAGRPD